MALFSKHFKILEAVHSSLTADTDLTTAIPTAQWRKQKKAWHRMQSWEPGGHVVPVRFTNPAHENKQLRYIFPVLVAVVWPGNGELTTGLEARLAVQERIGSIFAWSGRSYSPAPMRALDTSLTGDDAFYFEHTFMQPGDPFMDGAFQRGFDAASVLVNVQVTAAKKDYSTLGA